jgi:hypothetical protein
MFRESSGLFYQESHSLEFVDCVLQVYLMCFSGFSTSCYGELGSRDLMESGFIFPLARPLQGGLCALPTGHLMFACLFVMPTAMDPSAHWSLWNTTMQFYHFFFFWWYWDLNSGAIPWATPPALVFWRVFQDRVSQTICPALTLNHDPPDLCLLSN